MFTFPVISSSNLMVAPSDVQLSHLSIRTRRQFCSERAAHGIALCRVSKGLPVGNFSHVRTSTRKAGIRTPRLEHLLREELNLLFESEVSDPQLADLQVERVHLAPNASIATVYVFQSAQPSHDDEATNPDFATCAAELSMPVQKALTRATAYLRSRLSDALPLKRSPELRFKPGLSRTSELYYADEDFR
jgi:ribosome-binding factor A